MDTLPVVLQDLVYSYEHQLGWHKVVDQITEFYQKHKRCVDLYMVEHWREKEWAYRAYPHNYAERHAPGGTLHREFLCSWHFVVLQAYRAARSEPASSYIGSAN